jgi:hypothetical protein
MASTPARERPTSDLKKHVVPSDIVIQNPWPDPYFIGQVGLNQVMVDASTLMDALGKGAKEPGVVDLLNAMYQQPATLRA